MACRIMQLEKELSVCTVINQREKVAENVEYIRVWRQMKQLNDKLIAAESTNNSLNAEINDRSEEEARGDDQVRSMSLARCFCTDLTLDGLCSLIAQQTLPLPAMISSFHFVSRAKHSNRRCKRP